MAASTLSAQFLSSISGVEGVKRRPHRAVRMLLTVNITNEQRAECSGGIVNRVSVEGRRRASYQLLMYIVWGQKIRCKMSDYCSG